MKSMKGSEKANNFYWIAGETHIKRFFFTRNTIMIIEGFIWYVDILDKLEYKHSVTSNEVEAVFHDMPIFHRIEKGNVKGEDLYRALGKTDSGRYLVVFFVYKQTHEVLVISARDMTIKERKTYAKGKK
jgi:uncharacterized protein